jgi:hypothetical protein
MQRYLAATYYYYYFSSSYIIGRRRRRRSITYDNQCAVALDDRSYSLINIIKIEESFYNQIPMGLVIFSALARFPCCHYLIVI